MITNRQTLRAKYEKNRETMNQSERDALREKHREMYGGPSFCEACLEHHDSGGPYEVGVWKPALYPCDVIKVLDATEPDPDCDHKKRNICLCDWGDDCAMNSEPDFTYCPECGEKL